MLAGASLLRVMALTWGAAGWARSQEAAGTGGQRRHDRFDLRQAA